MIRSKELNAFQEEIPLVHWGYKKEPSSTKLINIQDLENEEYFLSDVLNYLEYVQPDFMMFKNNKYLTNKKQTRYAGYPDLIVEVWSDGNSRYDRECKLDLYSTSPITEHWYIEQDSNEVKCYYGTEFTGIQTLKEILCTKDDIKFDLRYLAL